MKINKVVRLGTNKTYGGRGYSIYAQIEFDGTRLSISGVEGPLPSGNALGRCGQIYQNLEIVNYAPGWDKALLSRFLHVWDRWHLNDANSACEHQRALGWTYKEHSDPVTFQGEACPTCGYNIGSAWLLEKVPQDVLDFLASLPDTDRTPAWV